MAKTKTNQEFRNEVYQLVGDEYEILSDYVSTLEHISIKHKICNYEYKVTPSRFLSGHRCPKCYGKVMKNKDTNYFKEEVHDLVGDEYTVLGDYKGSRTKILIKHNCEECGNNEWMVQPADFLNNQCRCPVCQLNKKRNTIENVKKTIEDAGYKLLSNEYKNAYTVLTIQCPVGHIYTGTYHNFQTGSRCRKCMYPIVFQSRRKPYEQTIDYIENKSNSGCKLLTSKEDYINTHQKLRVQCSCGNVYQVSFMKFFTEKQYKCRECTKKEFGLWRRRPYNNVKEFIEITSNSGCLLLTTEDKYKTTSKKIKLLCKCGNEFKTTFNAFHTSYKRQCNDCSVKSLGELKVREYLESQDIIFKEQFYFDDCKGKTKSLPFDFAIFQGQDKTQLKCLIEYDGELHYRAVKHFGGEQGFLTRQLHDKIKTDYCTRNNIKLIRIPYWEFNNIKEFLDNELRLIS